MKNHIILNAADNVGVALMPLKKGESVGGVCLVNDIPTGHKFALRAIRAGGDIIKYANPIGLAVVDIRAGEHIHTHNIATKLAGELDYEYRRANLPIQQRGKARLVDVFVRKNGQVGIRNDIFIVPTVGCVNRQAQMIAHEFNKLYPDSACAFTHPYGCSQLGDDHERTALILKNIAAHPNSGGALVLGLGCENNQIDAFRRLLGEIDEKRIKFLTAQGVSDEVSAGVELVGEIYSVVKNDKRVSMPMSCLNIGLKCGGSDGFSGITANPLLGRFCDYHTANGGAAVLTEVPEMFGAEHLLMARAKDRAVFERVVALVNDFKDYYSRSGQPVYENPSPGNKAGGITTLEDKSLGCTQKAGTGEVCDVLGYGDTVRCRGLSLLDGPGNDMVAVTNLGAAGCHLVLFTTGRGTPFGGFVPTIKISTNTALFEKKRNWIDFDAGGVLDIGFEQKLDELADFIGAVASGKKTQNELNQNREISIFKSGVTL